MRVRYRGPHQRVAVPLPNGNEAEVANGKEIDLRDESYGLTAADADALAKSLAEQESNWALVEDEPTTKTAGKPSAEKGE